MGRRFSEENLPERASKQKAIYLSGGLDQVTPNNLVPPGRLRKSRNFEADLNFGYTSVEGYELFSGIFSPSSALYYRHSITVTGEFSLRDTITGATSGATAVVVAVVTTSSPSYLVTTKLTGTFTNSEDLTVSGSKEGESLDNPIPGGAPSNITHAQYLNIAADEYRRDVAKPVGSGRILGLGMLGDDVFAFRNNVGGTEANLWKSSGAGWVQIPLGFELAFTSGGTYDPDIGETITGATSGATATLTNVMLESGSWASGTAAGKFIFLTDSGTFQAENINIGGNGDVCTISGDSEAITILPDGRYEIIVDSFSGLADSEKLYGADKVNRGFEFDGVTFSPIDTGMVVDRPIHVGKFKNHLFFSFAGSAQHSGIGVPYSFQVISGAAELAVGDNVAAFKDQPGAEGNGAFAIISKNRIHVLYGTSSADWNLVQFRSESGAFPYTVQEFGMTLMMDDRGVKDMRTTQAFGNFLTSTLSEDIQPWLNERRQKVSASCISRDKGQYRLFFNDKYALYVTVNKNKIVGMMPILLSHSVTCAVSREVIDGSEKMYFGTTDGGVYQQDIGTSFDGSSISTYMELHYAHLGTPRLKKRFLTAAIDLSGGGYHDFAFSYKLGYGKLEISTTQTVLISSNFQAPEWDSPDMVWDNFSWDGDSLEPSRVKLRGKAENIALIFKSNEDYFSPIQFSGIQLRIRDGKQLK